jgi:GT2 family glycosyltransferase
VQLLDSRGQISRSCSRFPTARGFLAQSIGMDRIVSKFGHSMKEWDHLQIREVDQVIGAFFFVRGFLFNDLSGFDERFFVYFEEVDFSYRAVLNGWTSSYLANVSAFHLGGGTSDQVKSHRLYYSLRSRVLYCQKHFSFYSSLLVWLCTLLVEPISRVSFAILHRSWSGVSETLRAYGMLWRWIPRWIWKGETR